MIYGKQNCSASGGSARGSDTEPAHWRLESQTLTSAIPFSKSAAKALCGCADSLVVDNHEFQDAFCSTPDAVMSTVALYDGCGSRSLLFAVTHAVCSAVRHNSAAQRMFVDTGVAAYISAMISLKV